MPRKTLKHDCPKCGGSGKVSMSDELMMVMNAIKYRHSATAPAIKRLVDPEDAFHPSAFNNRLNALRHMGFVTRVKKGRTWKYMPTKKSMLR